MSDQADSLAGKKSNNLNNQGQVQTEIHSFAERKKERRQASDSQRTKKG